MSSALPGIDEKKAESLSVNHLNANVNNGKRNSGHLATDSEIISDLHNVFKNFDIAGIETIYIHIICLLIFIIIIMYIFYYDR